jgi:polyprenyldihydroxybenzoate methyltransferase/3-demethylubiquinol 3-O-methyltransferase
LQPLARIGASVTGIDAGQNMIDIAQSHCCEDPSLSDSITYICGTIEEHAHTHKEFYDAVVASEVLEHVVHKDLFLDACVSSLKVRRHSIVVVVVVVVVVIVIVIFLLFLE